uniref:Uncharacterized protein n=1 Tax=Cannabis sativa TaxID=3483 RepID=A0A803PCP3_CANSA
MAPAVGTLLADLALTGETKGLDLEYFRIGRFSENPKEGCNSGIRDGRGGGGVGGRGGVHVSLYDRDLLSCLARSAVTDGDNGR